ncbi:MAG: hypothetical protein ACOC8A_00880 [bacterium]
MRTRVLVVLAALTAGCGREEGSAVDKAPFREALVAYLAAGHMEMEPQDFERIDIEGQKATAIVRMAPKDEMGYGLRPRWTVVYRKTADGWEVAKAGPKD